VLALIGVVIWLVVNPASYDEIFTKIENTGAESGVAVNGEAVDENGVVNDGMRDGISDSGDSKLAVDVLEELEVKGRAPKTGYTREQFYDGWPSVDGCSLRQRIIRRELGETAVILDGCNVVAGEYDEPYTGKHLVFKERAEILDGIQIDHVVALSDAWQKGAQKLSVEERYALATDALNLLAVDAAANKQKSDGDAATWLPANKKFRCQYVARQVSVKYKYSLWVTEAEKEAIARILANCPNESAIGV
jgi:hypothetical protein